MNHTRAASAKQVGSASVAVAGTWRVSVGGDRVEDMAPDAILRAFRDGKFNLRTPLWPPGASGWQALGNFAEFQVAATDPMEDCADNESADGSDDAPSHSGAFSRGHGAQNAFAALGGAAATGSLESVNLEPVIRVVEPRPMTFFSARPTQRVPPLEQAKASAPIAPVWLAPIIHGAAPPQLAIPSSPPEFRPKNRGWWLLPGVFGLILFGSAMLTTRNNLAALAAKREQALHKPSPPIEPVAPLVVEPAAPLTAASTATDAPAAAAAAAAAPATVAKTDSVTSATTPPDGVLDEAAGAARANVGLPAKGGESQASASPPGAAPSKAAAVKNAKSRPNRWARARAKAAGASHRIASVQQSAPYPGPEPSPVELQMISSAPEELTADSTLPTSRAALKASAREALQNARGLASSCHPNGGPSGPGRVRVIYSPDGNVQSVEILTAKFRDTTTGSCVRMVFRRAKIAAFQGEPTTFLADFAIPE